MNDPKYMIIAIDGPAASGKGTVAKKLAEKLGFSHLDTGKLYRVVGYKLSQKMPGFDKIDKNSPKFQEVALLATELATDIKPEDTQNWALESEVTGRYASIISSIPEVRAALLQYQRDFALSGGKGAVLDGRDIGTVIVPTANFKFFITASAEIRANRRFLQLQKMGKDVTEDAVLQDILDRDKRDIERKDAPLKAADDAIVIDTSELNIKEVFEKCLNIVKSKDSA